MTKFVGVFFVNKYCLKVLNNYGAATVCFLCICKAT